MYLEGERQEDGECGIAGIDRDVGIGGKQWNARRWGLSEMLMLVDLAEIMGIICGSIG